VLGAVVLLALILTALPAPAAQTAGDGGAGQEALSAPLAVDLHLDRVWTFLENSLNNRRRMVQFGVVGMCIALYVMFRARG
jgi:hypothetical protein